jgi:hypothetical protein
VAHGGTRQQEPDVGFGTRMTSPGAVMACAILAKPSFEPIVATICVSGSSFTPKRRS